MDLQRITGVSDDDTIAGEIGKVQARTSRHDATVAHELHNAVMSGGHLFTPRAMHRLGVNSLPLLARRTRRIRDAVLASTNYGIRYFGHWMTDDLPLTMAAQQLGTPVSGLQNPTAHQMQYLALLDLQIDVAENVFLDKIIVLDDVGQNTFKRERYASIRERVRSRLTQCHRDNPGVLLLRGRTGAWRTLLNEEAVADAVRQRGFKVLYPENCTASELAENCLDAKVVIGVEGSQLMHGVSLMSTSGTLFVLQPPSRFNAVLRGRCNCEGMRFAFQVGHLHGATRDFTIDIGAVNRMLDRIGTLQSDAS